MATGAQLPPIPQISSAILAGDFSTGSTTPVAVGLSVSLTSVGSENHIWGRIVTRNPTAGGVVVSLYRSTARAPGAGDPPGTGDALIWQTTITAGEDAARVAASPDVADAGLLGSSAYTYYLTLATGGGGTGTVAGGARETVLFGQSSLRTVPAGGRSEPMSAGTGNVLDYGASGSILQTTGSITAGTNRLTVQEPIDFRAGQGIMVEGAGATSSFFSMGGSVGAQAVGTPGATAYQYVAAIQDQATQQFTICGAATVSAGNETLDASNYNLVSITPSFLAGATYTFDQNHMVVWGKTAGHLALLAVIPMESIDVTGVGVATNPPPIGPHFSAGVTYTYVFTVTNWDPHSSAGTETPPVYGSAFWNTHTQGTTLTAVRVTWEAGDEFVVGDNLLVGARIAPRFARFVNIYRKDSVSETFGFLAQVSVMDLEFVDSGNLEPDISRTFPSAFSFHDSGKLLADSSWPGIPLTPPSLTGGDLSAPVLYSTITGIAGNVLILADNAGTTVENAAVSHWDTPAFQGALAAHQTVVVPGDGRVYRLSGHSVDTGHVYLYPGQALVGSFGWAAGVGTGGGAPPQVSVPGAGNFVGFTPPSGQPVLQVVEPWYSPIIAWGGGTAVSDLAFVWPYQAYGPDFPVIAPAAAAYAASGGNEISIERLTILGGWNGVSTGQTGWSGWYIDRIWAQTFNNIIRGVVNEFEIANIFHNNGTLANTGGNLLAQSGATGIQIHATVGLIHNTQIDARISIDWTVQDMGGVIQSVWQDDWVPVMNLQHPRYGDDYRNKAFQFQISDIFQVAGSADIHLAPWAGGVGAAGNNAATVHLSNVFARGSVYLDGGQCHVLATNIFNWSCLAGSQSTDWFRVQLANSVINGGYRFQSKAGTLEATIANCRVLSTDGDSVAAGAHLYVIDRDTRRQEKLRIPSGTAFSGSPDSPQSVVVGHVLVPYSQIAGGTPATFTVLSVWGEGYTAGDMWQISGPTGEATLLTTTDNLGDPATAALHASFAGLGTNQNISSPFVPLYSQVLPASNIRFVPYAIQFVTQYAGVTVTPIDVAIEYCVSPTPY